MEKQKCPSCKREFSEKVSICNNCNFPFDGTEKEKSVHIGRFINKKGIISDSDNSIKKVKKILYAVAAFNVVFMIIGFTKGSYLMLDIVINGFLTLIFLFCGIFLEKKPLILTIIPLILMIGIYILNYLTEPKSIFSGIFIKLIILGSLIYSIYLIINAEKFKKNYQVEK